MYTPGCYSAFPEFSEEANEYFSYEILNRNSLPVTFLNQLTEPVLLELVFAEMEYLKNDVV